MIGILTHSSPACIVHVMITGYAGAPVVAASAVWQKRQALILVYAVSVDRAERCLKKKGRISESVRSMVRSSESGTHSTFCNTRHVVRTYLIILAGGSNANSAIDLRRISDRVSRSFLFSGNSCSQFCGTYLARNVARCSMARDPLCNRIA